MEKRLKLLYLLRLVRWRSRTTTWWNSVRAKPEKASATSSFSPYAILLTGPTTVANLFYNIATEQHRAGRACGMQWRSTRSPTCRRCRRRS